MYNTQKQKSCFPYAKHTNLLSCKLDFQKVNRHTEGKWLIHGIKRRKDNQLESLESPVEYHKVACLIVNLQQPIYAEYIVLRTSISHRCSLYSLTGVLSARLHTFWSMFEYTIKVILSTLPAFYSLETNISLFYLCNAHYKMHKMLLIHPWSQRETRETIVNHFD